MYQLKVDERLVELNADGFLERPEDWDEDVARAIGRQNNIPILTDDHWKVIYYLRGYFERFRIAPMIRKLCKETGLDLNEIERIFPGGPAKGACRVAGLPRPAGCL